MTKLIYRIRFAFYMWRHGLPLRAALVYPVDEIECPDPIESARNEIYYARFDT